MHVFSTKVVQLAGAPPDPAKHVRFTDGMILGVDDFTQEFAYLSNRDRWIVRDLIGYGTVSGLRLWIEDDGAKGPRVVVEPGVAVTPRGDMVRVPTAQCAPLNEWLAGADQVTHLLNRPTPFSPPDDRVDLYVTLCYRECEIDDVPIPGEPCRHEGEMSAPSRILDDFRLELRFTPPAQPDEDAVRDFVAWLSSIPIVDGASSHSLSDFLDVVRSAAFLTGSPPAGLPDFMYGSPPGSLQIARVDACRYLRAAFRVWVTELRPRWYASWWLAHARCDGGKTDAAPKMPEACLLLARLDVPLVPAALIGPTRWQVPDASGVTIDERRRPFLLPLRMLQEWLFCGWHHGSDAAMAASGAPALVAAGLVTVGQPATGPYSLNAALDAPSTTVVRITFAGFSPTESYAIAALPGRNARVEYLDTTSAGIGLTITPATRTVVAGLPLMVQISRVG